MTDLAIGAAGAAVVAAALAVLALTTILRGCRTPMTDRLAMAGAAVSTPLVLGAAVVVVVRFLELSFP